MDGKPEVLELPPIRSARRLEAAGFVEEALCFDCAGETLIGVLSMPRPDVRQTGTALLIIVGGPQYRAGAHRQFVQLARALASDRHAVLRFDARGMGDSSGVQRDFQAIGDDIAAAASALRSRLPSIQRLVLFGLCDGASAALMCLDRPGVRADGLCLLNPWVRSPSSLARTHLKHYYAQRLVDRDFWRKLFVGRIGVRQIVGLVASLRASRRTGHRSNAGTRTFQESMAIAWRRCDAPVLLLLSQDDLTAREFAEHAGTDAHWHGLLARPGVVRVDLADADHTLSSVNAQHACEEAIRSWLGALTPSLRSSAK